MTEAAETHVGWLEASRDLARDILRKPRRLRFSLAA